MIEPRNNEEEKKLKLNDFIILKKLSEGQFGYVAKVKSKLNNKIYSMKKYNNPKNEKFTQLFKKEVIILKKLNNENICKYYGSFEEEDNSLYIITEYMDNGNLFDLLFWHIKKKEKLTEEKLLNIFLQCSKALVYIHEIGLIHQDIKLANFVLDTNEQIKLIDFKTSTIYNNKNIFTNEEIRDIIKCKIKCGSGDFRMPNINNLNNIDGRIDVYSLGVTFCSLAYFDTSLPSKDNNTYSQEIYGLIQKIFQKSINYVPTSLYVYNELKKIYVNKYFRCTGIKSCFLSLFSFPDLIDYITQINENNIINKILQDNIKCIKNVITNYQNKENKEKWIDILLFEFREIFSKNKANK